MSSKYIGKIFGPYEIIDCKGGLYYGKCKYCGNVSKNILKHFKNLKNTSCTHIDKFGFQRVPERRWKNQRINRIFQDMKGRCYNPNHKNYNTYGDKGIRIHEEWLKNPIAFEEWALNNGYEDDLTIDRIDSNQNYCPENCRWITLVDNSRYKSTTRCLTVDGETNTGRQWADYLGIGQNRINTYVRRYGVKNTEEFIHRYKENPGIHHNQNQSIYDIYMS